MEYNILVMHSYFRFDIHIDTMFDMQQLSYILTIDRNKIVKLTFFSTYDDLKYVLYCCEYCVLNVHG